jgi:hypothetical protein
VLPCCFVRKISSCFIHPSSCVLVFQHQKHAGMMHYRSTSCCVPFDPSEISLASFQSWPGFPQAAATFFDPQGISRAHNANKQAKAWPGPSVLLSAMWRAGQGGRHSRKRIMPCRAAVSSCFLSWPGAGPPGPYRPQERRVARDVDWQRCRVAPDRIISCFPLML